MSHAETIAGFNKVVEGLNRLSPSDQNRSLEEAFIRYRKISLGIIFDRAPANVEPYDYILQRYRLHILELPIPSTLIQEATKQRLGVGRRIKLDALGANVKNLTDPAFYSTPNAKTVYINTYATYMDKPATRYRLMHLFYNPRRLRLYDPATNTWRDLNRAELWAYNQVIQATRVETLYQFDVLGRFTVIYDYSDKSVCIRDRDAATKLEIERNSKQLHMGKAALHFSVMWLAYIAANFGSTMVDITKAPMDKTKLIPAIKEIWADSRLSRDIKMLEAIDHHMSLRELQFVYAFRQAYPSIRCLKSILKSEILQLAITANRVIYI
uniref:Uncharacterized protein n=1 Tax=Pithovirus LCPAC103 TaxID=2506588 RepID=A0A481Z4G8_9VIRU|nr:MAG: hypothetical protein LCPAC103_00230 [Pithovirus LCPAC103]